MAESILDFDSDLDIPLFEQIVQTAMMGGSDVRKKKKKLENLWFFVFRERQRKLC